MLLHAARGSVQHSIASMVEGERGLGDQIRFYQLRRDGAMRLEPLEPGEAPEYLRWSLRKLHERLRRCLAS